jgi:hypothetical protein
LYVTAPKNVTRAYGCYGITLRREARARSIAARNARDNRFNLFDKTLGFSGRSANSFKNFLDWYFDKTAYKNRYTKLVFGIGVTPPAGPMYYEATA